MKLYGLVPLLLPSISLAGSLTLGTISFDTLIPGEPGLPGVNAFTISNFTGDPGLGGFALPPDFPVLTALTFTNAAFTLNTGGTPESILLDDLGPGFATPDSLLFPETTSYLAAVFSATLSQTSFLLADGSTFTADVSRLTVSLVPSLGLTLTPGIDLALITVTGTQEVVPEPRTLIQVFIIAPWILRRAFRRLGKPL